MKSGCKVPERDPNVTHKAHEWSPSRVWWCPMCSGGWGHRKASGGAGRGVKPLCQEVIKYCRRKAPCIKSAVTSGLGIESKRWHRAIKTHHLQNGWAGITSCQSLLVFQFISKRLTEERAGRWWKSSSGSLFVGCQPRKKKICRRSSKDRNGLGFSDIVWKNSSRAQGYERGLQSRITC